MRYRTKKIIKRFIVAAALVCAAQNGHVQNVLGNLFGAATDVYASAVDLASTSASGLKLYGDLVVHGSERAMDAVKALEAKQAQLDEIMAQLDGKKSPPRRNGPSDPGPG